MYYILYNPHAQSDTGEEHAKNVVSLLEGNDCVLTDMTTVSYEKFFKNVGENDAVVVCGGDGTLNCFANDTAMYRKDTKILYYAMGTGNDFLNDIGADPNAGLVELNQYLENLPEVTVNDEKRLFLNNVGFGIDGYCCEVGDQQRLVSDKPVNYTAIAIKGLLYAFKRRKATVTIDGKTLNYKDVWIAATMKGRFYGGGMMSAPNQDRLNPDHSVSLVVYHCPFKLKSLIVFPSIFKGEHIKHTEMVDVIEGHNIEVEFDEPCALQIDGETRLNIKKYSVKA